MRHAFPSDVASSRCDWLFHGKYRRLRPRQCANAVLLVGDNDDFRYLHELLTQTGEGHLGLDHARSTEEALVRLSQTTYDLLLCEYKPDEGAACACCTSYTRTVRAHP